MPEEPQEQDVARSELGLSPIAEDSNVAGIKQPRKISVLLVCALVLLGVEVTVVYFIDLQPSQRLHTFKTAVAESNKDWGKLQTRLRALDFEIEISSYGAHVEMCPLQNSVQDILSKIDSWFPFDFSLGNWIAAPKAWIHIDPKQNKVTYINYGS